MPQDGYIGSDMAVAVGFASDTVSVKATAFEVDLPEREVTFEPLDTERILRRQLTGTCTITMTGYESDQENAGSFAILGAAKLKKTPITILSYSDKGSTPATRLPADFFDEDEGGFPLTGWRVASVRSGPTAQAETVKWTAVLKPDNI